MEFQPRVLVLTHIIPKRFPRGTLTKLQSRKVSLFKVLQKLGNNAFLLEQPLINQFNPIFNIEDLIAYEGHDHSLWGHTLEAYLPKIVKQCDTIEAIIDG